MSPAARDVPGGWYRKHDYTIRVGTVRPGGARPGRRSWARAVLVLKETLDEKPSWPGGGRMAQSPILR